MRSLRHAGVLFVALGLLGGPQDQPTSSQPDAPAARVIVRVSRNREVNGFVELENDDVIVIRTLDEKVESFPKPRLLKIVRLRDPMPGQEGTVILRNGQLRKGIIIEDTFDHVLIEINGIRTKLVRRIVDYVVLVPTFEELYAQYKATLKPNMPDAHLDLCRWLLKERRYELARAELLELFEYAQLPDATRLLRFVDAQLALASRPDDAPREPQRATTRPDGNKRGLPDGILSRADVNLIRVYEIDFDRPPKVAVPHETIRALIQNYRSSTLIPDSEEARTAMFRLEPIEIVRLMFELRARDLYPQVKVLSEPWGLNMFRRRVHDAWLINRCATSRCHGGPDAGRFRLHRRHYKDERVRYSNLLTLQRLDLDRAWPLINYDKPENSLIIQYGLPASRAHKPHPAVKGWKPIFTRSTSRMLSHTVNWIEAMMQPRPEYPLEYQPPAGPTEEVAPTPPPAGGDRPGG